MRLPIFVFYVVLKVLNYSSFFINKSTWMNKNRHSKHGQNNIPLLNKKMLKCDLNLKHFCIANVCAKSTELGLNLFWHALTISWGSKTCAVIFNTILSTIILLKGWRLCVPVAVRQVLHRVLQHLLHLRHALLHGAGYSQGCISPFPSFCPYLKNLWTNF